jgi:hypothetical protein
MCSVRGKDCDWQISVSRVVFNHDISTYLHCLWAKRQWQFCTHLDRSSLPSDIHRTIHLDRCMLLRCFSVGARLRRISIESANQLSRGCNSRIAGNLPPDTPTMESLPTFPRRRRSKRVSPTTPTFLSDLDAPPPTNPVVYSPVPT